MKTYTEQTFQVNFVLSNLLSLSARFSHIQVLLCLLHLCKNPQSNHQLQAIMFIIPEILRNLT